MESNGCLFFKRSHTVMFNDKHGNPLKDSTYLTFVIKVKREVNELPFREIHD